MSIKFAQVNDVHLGYHQYGLEERANDFASAWLWTCHEIVDRGCQFVLLCGDLFNHRDVKPQAYLDATYGLDLLRNNNIPVYAIEGNHEQMRDGTKSFIDVLHYESYLTKLYGVTIEQFGELTICGYNWAKGNTAKYLEGLSFDKRTVLALHAAYEPEVNFTVPEIVSRELLQGLGAGYIGIGHIHKPFDDGVVHSCGSLETWSVTELGYKDRGFNVVTYDGDYHIERVVTPKRDFAYVDVNVSDCTSKRMALEEINKQLLSYNNSFEGWVISLSVILPDLGISEGEVLRVAGDVINPLFIRPEIENIKDTTIKDSLKEDVQLLVEQEDDPKEIWEKVVEGLAHQTSTDDKLSSILG